MRCETALSLIDADFDGELDVIKHLEVHEHMEDCASCKAHYLKLDRLRKQIRSGASFYQTPEAVRHTVLKTIRRPYEAWPWKWMCIAASLLLGISVTTNVFLRDKIRASDQSIAQEVVSEHVRSLMGEHLVDVVSSDRHTVKPWFPGKLNFSPEIKDLAEQGFPLAGGRSDYIGDRTVAALVFRRGRHVINLFTWPAVPAHKSELSRNGYHVVAWSSDGMIYWAVSDLNLTELEQFAKLYQG